MDCSMTGSPVLQYPLKERKKESEVDQSCPTLCNCMDCSLSGFSVHGIFQARVPEWVAISFLSGSFWPREWSQVSSIAGGRFTLWATREDSHYPLEFAQIHVHWDGIQSNLLICCHALLLLPSLFPSIRNFLLQWVSSSYQVAKVLVCQSLQWIFRVDFL